MNILLISGEYPPHTFGGGGSFMYHYALNLVKHNMNVTIIAHKLTRKRKYGTIELEKHKNIKIYWIDIPRWLYPRHVTFQMFVRNLIKKLINKKDFDIIHLNTGLLCPLIYKIIKKYESIVTIHGDPIESNKLVLLSKYSNLFSKAYASLYLVESNKNISCELSNSIPVFVSSHLASIILRYKNIRDRPYYVINNGINIDFINRILSRVVHSKYLDVIKKLKSKGKRILVYPARMHQYKNQLFLVKLMKYLWFFDKNYYLFLLGDGPMLSKIYNIIKENNLNKIILTGKLSYEETIKIMSMATAIPFPSLHEAYPMTILEAYALQKPVVVFDMPYLEDLKGLDNLLVARNVEEFLQLLLEIDRYDVVVDDDKLSMISMDSTVEKYIRVYESVVDRRVI